MNAITPAATMGTLLTWLLVDPLAEPDARPAFILVGELDAGGLQSSPNMGLCFRGNCTRSCELDHIPERRAGISCARFLPWTGRLRLPPRRAFSLPECLN